MNRRQALGPEFKATCLFESLISAWDGGRRTALTAIVVAGAVGERSALERKSRPVEDSCVAGASHPPWKPRSRACDTRPDSGRPRRGWSNKQLIGVIEGLLRTVRLPAEVHENDDLMIITICSF